MLMVSPALSGAQPRKSLTNGQRTLGAFVLIGLRNPIINRNTFLSKQQI